MDGFQATEEIRKMEGGQIRVPIVSLTANVMPGIVEQCVQAGMDYCIFISIFAPANFFLIVIRFVQASQFCTTKRHYPRNHPSRVIMYY